MHWKPKVPAKQDHIRMNVAPDQTIILGLQIYLDHRSLSSIDKRNLDDGWDKGFNVVL